MKGRLTDAKGTLIAEDPKVRFWRWVEPMMDDRGCWQWNGAIYTNGYGSFKVGSHHLRAHRYSWELHFGPIPKGLFVLHRCDNPPCVNPSHLFLGTNDDNVRDMWAKGRYRGGVLRGESNPLAKLTEEKVRAIRRLPKGSVRLAEEFGISYELFRQVRRREAWRHVE